MSETNIAATAAPATEAAPTIDNAVGEVQAGLEAIQGNSPEQTPEQKLKTVNDAKKAAEIKKNNKKKLKLKVDGKEEDYEFDPENEQELVKNLQLSRAAQKRMAEMANMKKDFSELFQNLTKNPLDFLGDKERGFGMDVEGLVKQYVEQKLADAAKSPEQLKSEATERELQRLKAERETERTQREREAYEAKLQTEIVKYDNMILNTLKNSEFKEPTPYVIKKMSDYLILGVQNGLDVTTDDILPIVREEIQNEIKQLINVAPEEFIDEVFGKEILNRIRKKNVSKGRQAAPQHASSVKDAGSSAKTEKPVEKQSYKSFFKF